MKHYKRITALIYGALLLICIGIVWFLGALNKQGSSSPQDKTGQESSAQTGADQEKEESNGSDGDKNSGPSGQQNGLDETKEGTERSESGTGEYDQESEEARQDRLEKERQKWLAEYRRQRRRHRKPSGEGTETEEEKPYEPPTLMLASDLHYMSSTTHDDGKAFWSMVEHDDGKIDQYSEEMLDTLVETAIENHPTALALTGDITLNGERINHELLAKKLQKVQDAGIPVVVIPGNHDIQNKNASTYFGDKREKAEYLESGKDFYDIYHEFGYDQSPNRDEASLSYVYPLDPSHWLLMMDSCIYDDGNHVEGRISDATLGWMETHLRVAKEHGIQVIVLAHHNLLQESRLFTTQCEMENGPEVTALLEKYQVPLYISGHLHVQRIREHVTGPGLEETQDGIHEIVLSPYSFPGNQYGMLSWDLQDNMTFETRKADVAAWAKANGSENPELLNFADWSLQYAKSVIQEQVKQTITMVPDDLKAEMASMYADLYFPYCLGEAVPWNDAKTTKAYTLWQRVDPKGKKFKEMQSMAEDSRTPRQSWTGGGRQQTGQDGS
ncbi:metallophosphoesterase [Clostridium sp. AF32-12BH]|uniref:metallophosphoesterase n=1 Tax=Clostridium sp. AF32-12BH TaxID=2292006 RepID=UPI000E48075F|nr:metallophosphoesterase [Clostridium sp. AF32-12BH]RHP40844.1 metallophosphoesterase [Clostridium sp. AF32-12BH]